MCWRWAASRCTGCSTHILSRVLNAPVSWNALSARERQLPGSSVEGAHGGGSRSKVHAPRALSLGPRAVRTLPPLLRWRSVRLAPSPFRLEVCLGGGRVSFEVPTNHHPKPPLLHIAQKVDVRATFGRVVPAGCSRAHLLGGAQEIQATAPSILPRVASYVTPSCAEPGVAGVLARDAAEPNSRERTPAASWRGSTAASVVSGRVGARSGGSVRPSLMGAADGHHSYFFGFIPGRAASAESLAFLKSATSASRAFRSASNSSGLGTATVSEAGLS
jgi:hypothetical protein